MLPQNSHFFTPLTAFAVIKMMRKMILKLTPVGISFLSYAIIMAKSASSTIDLIAYDFKWLEDYPSIRALLIPEPQSDRYALRQAVQLEFKKMSDSFSRPNYMHYCSRYVGNIWAFTRRDYAETAPINMSIVVQSILGLAYKEIYTMLEYLVFLLSDRDLTESRKKAISILCKSSQSIDLSKLWRGITLRDAIVSLVRKGYTLIPTGKPTELEAAIFNEQIIKEKKEQIIFNEMVLK